MSRREKRSGFSLLEMIVAIALLGLAVTGLIAMMSASLAGAAMTREYTRAAMLAKTRMNELLTMRPIPLGIPMQGSFDEASGWEAEATPAFAHEMSATGSRLVRIDLKIWWESGGERKSVDFEGYRRVRIR